MPSSHKHAQSGQKPGKKSQPKSGGYSGKRKAVSPLEGKGKAQVKCVQPIQSDSQYVSTSDYVTASLQCKPVYAQLQTMSLSQPNAMQTPGNISTQVGHSPQIQPQYQQMYMPFSPQSAQGPYISSMMQAGPPPPTLMSPDTTPEWAMVLMSKVDTMSKKLAKLDVIENSICELKNDVQKLQSRVVEVEKSQKFISEKFEENKSTLNANAKDINKLKSVIDQVMEKNVELANTITDLQSRSMRENLMFFGVAESPVPEPSAGNVNAGEGEATPPVENCMQIIKDILTKQLEMTDPIVIDRAHRIGVKQPGKSRPIVVKFNQYQQREEVRTTAAVKLKDKPIYVRQQFPQSVIKARKLLMPEFIRAKQEKKKAYFVRDKLYINGQPHTPKPDTVMP